MASTDWVDWHEAYERPGSGLASRLTTVRTHIARRLDASAPRPVRVVSACAGDGRDLLGVLAGRADAQRVSALLVEQDADLVARAVSAADALTAHVEVRQGDAALSDTYVDAVPADLVLLCGIFGNVSERDIQTTIEATPQLCAPGAEVVWTRHRRGDDATPRIRRWFAESGFDDVAFVAPDPPDEWSVGVHRYLGPQVELEPGRRWFHFVR